MILSQSGRHDEKRREGKTWWVCKGGVIIHSSFSPGQRAGTIAVNQWGTDLPAPNAFLTHAVNNVSAECNREVVMHPIRWLLAFLRVCPVVEHPDGKKFVRVNDHWMPLS